MHEELYENMTIDITRDSEYYGCTFIKCKFEIPQGFTKITFFSCHFQDCDFGELPPLNFTDLTMYCYVESSDFTERSTKWK